ncbi:MAG: type II toxin-antitoxin system HicB family antitoxin [Xanthobacteraceae bacterium]
MLGYRVKLEPDDKGMLLVSCPSLPELTTFGDDETDAMRHAVGAIEEALASRMTNGEDVPEGQQRGPRLVRLPALTVLKVELYRQLREAGITRAELARRLDWKRESVDRLFRLDHASRLEQIEAALAALGRSVSISVHAAA